MDNLQAEQPVCT